VHGISLSQAQTAYAAERLAALDPTAKKKDKSVEDLLNDLK